MTNNRKEAVIEIKKEMIQDNVSEMIRLNSLAIGNNPTQTNNDRRLLLELAKDNVRLNKEITRLSQSI